MKLIKINMFLIRGIIAGLSILFLCKDLSSQTRYLFTGSASSDWSDTLNWTPYGVPSEMDTVVISTSTVDASTGNDINIAALYFLGGTITGTDSILISDTISWSKGRFDGLGSTTFMTGSRAAMHGDQGRTINTRNIYWNGDGYVSGTGTLSINGAELSVGGNLIIAGIGNVYGTGVNGIIPKITVEEGAVLFKNGKDFIISLLFEVNGRVELDSGIFELRGDNNWAGEFIGAANTTLWLSKRTSTWLESSDLTTEGNFEVSTTLTMNGNYSVGNLTLISTQSQEHHFNGTIEGLGDSLIILGGINHFYSDIILPNYTYIDGGTNYGSGTIAVIDTLIWEDGAFTDTGNIHIMKGAVVLLSGTRGKLLWKQTVLNEGTILLTEGMLQMSASAEIHNHGTFIVSPAGRMTQASIGNISSPSPIFFNNSDGVFIKKGSEPNTNNPGINFFNDGLFVLDHAIFSISWAQGGGEYRQRSGITKMDSSRFISSHVISIDSGLFMGSGYVEGDLFNAGIIDPGLDSGQFGIIYIEGNYTQDTTGTLAIDIGGHSPRSGYDQLTTNTASLAGLLDLEFSPDFQPSEQDRIWAIRWLDSDFEGTFDSISNLINPFQPAFEYTPLYTLNDLTLYGKEENRDMWIQFVGRKKARPGQKQKIKLYYGAYNRDTLVVPLVITMNGEMYLRPKSQYVHYPEWVPWESPVDEEYFDNTVPDEFFSGVDTRKIPLLITLPPQKGSGGIGSAIQPGTPYLKLDVKPVCDGPPSRAVADAGFQMDADVENCLWGVANELVGFLPGGPCIKSGVKLVLGGFQQYSNDLNGRPQTWGNFLAGMGWDVGKCAISFLPGGTLVTKTAESLDKIMDGAGQIGLVNDCASVLLPDPNGKQASTSVACVASLDPNEKVGPDGYTDLKFYDGTDPSVFSIYFENVDSATAPAQTVYITDQLYPQNWDFSTFSFLPITIGDTTFLVPPFTSSFDIEVDLRPANNLLLKITGNLNEISGLLEWTFTSLDPATHKLTTDPMAGFLPPNVNHPEGQGDVGYLIQPNLDLPSGTSLGSEASIIFDTNEPILTNTWLNHIDREAPSSQMVAFSATLETGEIPLNWSGLDNHSGIRNYILYVSENEQSFEEFLTTSDTSYIFSGDSCKNYRFYTVAVDSVGNMEETKEPEVFVTVNPFQTIDIDLDGSSEFCQGDSVLLRALSDTSLSYTWYRNGIALAGNKDSIIYAVESGSYTVNVEKNEACMGLSDPVSITVNQLPDVSLSVNGNIVSAQEGFQEYIWYINDILVSGAANSNLEAEMSGDYVVRVTDANGCMQVSDPLIHEVVNTGNLRSNDFVVYPNPTNEWIILKIPEKLQNTDLYISILDLNGRYILKSVRLDVLNDEASIYLGQYSAGLYNCIIEDKVADRKYQGQFILK